MDPLDVARKAAHSAAQVIKEIIDEGREKEVLGIGESGDTTLLGDKLSENTIIATIQENMDSFKIISEEVGEKVFGSNPEYTFIIDPIDGSRNYKRRVPLYTISVAVARGDTIEDIVAGVVYFAPLRLEFYAKRGEGTYANGKRIFASNKRDLKGGIIGLSFTPKAQFLPQLVALNLATKGAVVRSWGSVSLELSYLAQGGIDGYIEAWGTMRVVDVAAAILIAKESGAKLLLRGKLADTPLLRLDERLSMVAASTQELLDKLVEAYREALGFLPTEVFKQFGVQHG